MEIKYKKDEGLILSGSNSNVLVSSKDSYKGDDYDVVFAKGLDGKGFLINMPGEYEIAGISVIAQSSKMDESVDVVEFIVDDISVVVINSGFKYSKTIHDNLGDVNVLVANVTESKSFEDELSKLDPDKFIVFGDKVKVDEAIQKSGISNINEESKIKIKADEFGEEKTVLDTYKF